MVAPASLPGMGFGEGVPNDDVGLLRRSLDGMPAGVLTIDAGGTIVQASGSALEIAPSLRPGVALRPALEELTHVEMVDRLLIRREVSTFPGRPGGAEHHWMLWGERNPQGEIVMTVWETDWNEVLNERRAAFTMAASHEMRGPLTAIRGFAEILNEDNGNLTPEQAEAAAIVERNARHLTVLVEDVFDLSRNSFGELRLEIRPTDLAELLDSVAAAARPRVEARGQNLECQLSELPEVDADPARTIQMITNLVNNASVHNPGGTSIRMSARTEGKWVAVEVADDGVGIPFDDAEEAFRSFRRGDRAAEGDRTGSGIGLAITRSLIQLHRGDITVESEPGEGSVFTLWFPVNRDGATVRGGPGPA